MVSAAEPTPVTGWWPTGGLGRLLRIAPAAAGAVVLVGAVLWPAFLPGRAGLGAALMVAGAMVGLIGVAHGLRGRSRDRAAWTGRDVRAVRENRPVSPAEGRRLLPTALVVGRRCAASVLNATGFGLFFVGNALTSTTWMGVVYLAAGALFGAGIVLLARELRRLTAFVGRHGGPEVSA